MARIAVGLIARIPVKIVNAGPDLSGIILTMVIGVAGAAGFNLPSVLVGSFSSERSIEA